MTDGKRLLSPDIDAIAGSGAGDTVVGTGGKSNVGTVLDGGKVPKSGSGNGGGGGNGKSKFAGGNGGMVVSTVVASVNTPAGDGNSAATVCASVTCPAVVSAG